MRDQHRVLWLFACAVVTAAVVAAAAQAAATYKGHEVAVWGVDRATNRSQTDCPPGANIVRGVIKPGDPMEFASVKVDFKVLATFKPGPLPKPVLYDESGKAYNTAQSFAEIGATPAFACVFSFRIPNGATLARFTLDTASIPLGAMGR